MIPVTTPVPATLRGVQRRIQHLLPKIDVVLKELSHIHPERRATVLRAFGPLEPLIRQYLDWHAERQPLIPPPVQTSIKTALRATRHEPPPSPPKPRRAA